MSTSTTRRRSAGGIRPAVSFAVEGHRSPLAWLASTAFAGGLVEAAFLITVTRAAFAITDGKTRVDVFAGRQSTIGETLWLALLLIVLRIALAAFVSWQSSRLSATVVARTRRRLASAFFQASWDVQQRQRSGNLQELMSSYSGQVSPLMQGINQSVVSTANLLALLGLAIGVEPLGAVVLVGSVAVLGSLLRPLRTVIRRRSRRAAEAGMELATAVNEASSLGLELHVFHVQDEAMSRMDGLIERSRRLTQRQQFASGLATPTYVGLAYLALVGALSIVASSTTTSLTSLGAAMLVMLRSLSYGQALQGAYVTLSSIGPVVDELSRQLRLFEAGERVSSGQTVGTVRSMAAEDVSFSYDVEPVLSGITFRTEPREIVGIVGPSGSGKSTLVQLLLGLRHPQEGRITADGRDIGTLDRAEWARKVTFVPQEAHLITASVADNIRFLRNWADDDAIEQAARMAHLHEDIVTMPGGYQRQIGTDGTRLSGGQQQRLCIARALVERPDLLILDEPTSALDVRSEHLIRTTLLELREHMAVMIIAHRLSTLDICDRIMVIQDGHLIGFDTPSNLERSSEFYREALQLSGLR